MAKVKMDKVRRLLGNRYGEDGRIATMQILGYIVDQGVDMFANDDNLDIAQIELALKCIGDLVTRASKEPKVIEDEGDGEEE